MGKRSRKNKMAAAMNQPQRKQIPVMPRNIIRETGELSQILLDRCSQTFGQSGRTEYEDYQQVYDIVQQLRVKQAKYVDLPDGREEHMASFMEWVQTNGTNTEAVEIHKYPDQGHGLRATKDLELMDLFLEIPRNVMLTTSQAQYTTLGPLVLTDRVLQNMPNILLAFVLLYEKKDSKSFWQPYINILPKEYTTPLYFTPEEVLLLKGSPAFSEVINQFRNITRQYAYFYNLFQAYVNAEHIPIRYFCYDEYRWAVSTVMTRQNQIPSKEQTGATATALIPLWDMCNHANGQLFTNFNPGKDCSECFAQQPVGAGEQIFIFYGTRSNAELMLNSGFVYEYNEHDKINIKLGISKNDPLCSMKSQLLAKVACTPSKQYNLYRSDEPVDSDMLLFVRVFSMTKDELSRCLEEGFRYSTLRDYDTWVSRENEQKVWTYIHTRATILLRSYPTTPETDDDRLRAKSLTEHERMTILLLLTEKRILNKTVDFALAMKQDVDTCPSKELKVTQPEINFASPTEEQNAPTDISNGPSVPDEEQNGPQSSGEQPSVVVLPNGSTVKSLSAEDEEIAKEIDNIEISA